MDKNLQQTVLEALREHSTPQRPVYLVGGAVRDMMLERDVHDLDFAVPGPTRALANDVACRLNGALYVLDEERDTTRVVLETGSQHHMLLDFASLRAGDLEGDLRARDFSINAMALDVAHPDRLIDPTGGFADLRAKQLRACGPDSMTSDPVRVLRAVRQALGFTFRIMPETLAQMRAAARLLPRVSAERLRDELLRIFEGSQVHLAIRILSQVGALKFVLPEMEDLKGVTQSAPHTADVWEHTLGVVQALEQLYPPLVGTYSEDKVPDLTVGSAVLWLGRYRQQMEEHFGKVLVPDRSLRSLLFFAALYHDIAKPQTRFQTVDGRIRFLEHDHIGKNIAANRARALALSAHEIQRIETIIEHHMRVLYMLNALQNGGLEKPARRTMYRYFKDTGPTGIDICLLALADLRGTYGVALPQDVWESALKVCRGLMEAYWEKSAEVVSPPRLLTGNDVMKLFNLKPGKEIGRLLAAVQEAQAAGEVNNREEAEEYARRWFDRRPEEEAREEGEH